MLGVIALISVLLGFCIGLKIADLVFKRIFGYDFDDLFRNY